MTALLGGCSYSDDEPGLFGRTPAADPSAPASAPDTPDSVAAIPLLGEATWTTADPRGIPVRIAIHGVRRVPGGTVLDWSVTALSPPDRAPGEAVESGPAIDLHESTDVLLVDGLAGRVYRPLLSRDDGGRCLCTPVGLASADLALGVPRLLQVAYPELPDSTRVIDVSISPVPVFSRIPVAPLGQVAAPIAATDLARPIEAAAPRGHTPYFRLPSGQEFAIAVDAVFASGTLTSVVWTLQAVSAGPGPGPGLAPVLTRNDAWRVAPLRLGRADREGPACLCSDPATWRQYLTEPGRRVTVVTNLGEIPRGTTRVDVLFPGVAPLRGIAVTPASDGAFRAAGSVPGPRRTWSYRPDRVQPGWRLYSWPTPVPKIPKGAFVATVEVILD
jgi:hypothetical protein